jgi:hypothetical protein
MGICIVVCTVAQGIWIAGSPQLLAVYYVRVPSTSKQLSWGYVLSHMLTDHYGLYFTPDTEYCHHLSKMTSRYLTG